MESLNKTIESVFRKTPLNAVAVVGQSLRMECRTNPNKTTQWFYSPAGQRLLWFVYNGEQMSKNFTPRFTIDTANGDGHHDLIATNVVMTDAGIYECAVVTTDRHDRSTLVAATAELVILESEPQCNSSLTNGSIPDLDYAAFQCGVQYSGLWTPSMRWSKRGYEISETPVVTRRNISLRVHYILSVVNFRVSAEDNNAMVTCETWFSEESKEFQYTNATNVPNSRFYWNYSLNVHFGVRNATIVPRKDSYRFGNVLDCTSKGNPSPSFLWANVHTKETIALGPRLVLNKVNFDVDQRYTIECIAQNYVDSEINLCSATIDVMIQETVQMPYGYIIATGVGIVSTLMAVVTLRSIKMKLNSRKSRINVKSDNENPQRLSADYDSVNAAEVNSSPSISATHSMFASTEAVSDAYNALMERPVIVHQPAVYSSLETNSSDDLVFPDRVVLTSPVYVNIQIY